MDLVPAQLKLRPFKNDFRELFPHIGEPGPDTNLHDCHPERSVRLFFRLAVFAGRADAESKDLRFVM